MATFSISKELVVTLKYYYEKKHKQSRNHTEIIFTFRSNHTKLGKYLCRSLFFDKVSGCRIAFLMK